MRRRSSAIPIAAMFVIFAAAFSVIFWPDVSMASKVAFFVTGLGCGCAMCRAVKRPSETEEK